MPVLKNPQTVTHNRKTQTRDAGGGFVDTANYIGTYLADVIDNDMDRIVDVPGVFTKIHRWFTFLQPFPPIRENDLLVVGPDTYTAEFIYDKFAMGTFQVFAKLMKNTTAPEE